MDGTLTDAGPLVAILNRNDNHHERTVASLDRVATPLLTVWPAVAEAMFLLGQAAGWKGQNALWAMILSGEVIVLPVGETLYPRVRALMAKYADLPMDLGDATLVAIGEQERLGRVFSLDHHFHVYRLQGKRSFEVIP